MAEALQIAFDIHKWDDLPWKPLMPPQQQWDVLPSFLIGEYMFFALSIIALLHAVTSSRAHVFLWFATFLTGSANDCFFMWLPVVDNFWQSQATVMITPRLPLYIPCVYNCFMYYSVSVVWRCRMATLSSACLTGIVAELFYAPYDIIGNKFLWWTWHDTDAAIAERWFGAPVGSSLWVITFSATFSVLLRVFSISPESKKGWFGYLSALLIIALTCTPLMIVQMSLFQNITKPQLMGLGLPDLSSLAVCLVVYLWVIAFDSSPWQRRPRSKMDFTLNCAVIIYTCVLTAIAVLADPEEHISTGIHQTYGPCNVTAVDIVGQPRKEYVCESEFREDYTFDCPNSDRSPSHYAKWYTVCGTPHRDQDSLVAVLAILAVSCSLTYTLLLRGTDNAKKTKNSRKTKRD